MPVIIEMDMPGSCTDCKLCIIGVCDFDVAHVTPTCALLEQDVGGLITERHKDCPLKECK